MELPNLFTWKKIYILRPADDYEGLPELYLIFGKRTESQVTWGELKNERLICAHGPVAQFQNQPHRWDSKNLRNAHAFRPFDHDWPRRMQRELFGVWGRIFLRWTKTPTKMRLNEVLQAQTIAVSSPWKIASDAQLGLAVMNTHFSRLIMHEIVLFYVNTRSTLTT